MSRLARRLFPDIIGMSYVEGEIQTDPLPPAKSTINIEPSEKIQPIKAALKVEAPEVVIDQAPSVPINEDKVLHLMSMIDGDENLRDLLLKKCRSNSIAEIPADKYQIALDWLRKKLDEQLMEDVKGEVSV